jgi:hypothetical protein
LRRERACWRLSDWEGVRVDAMEWLEGRVSILVFVLLRKTPRGGPSRWNVSMKMGRSSYGRKAKASSK